jgi:hypothetical protein
MQYKFNMAPSNALTVEEIINGFPNPVLPKIDNDPTFEEIQITTHQLNANTISIPLMAGGGAHWHLGIIMSHVELFMCPRGWNPSIPTLLPSSHLAPMPWMQINLHE